jgi:two-component system NtrC family sensor kinase
LTTIYTEAQRIRDIVRNLLAFSRQSRASEVRELDVNAVLGTTLGLLERQLCVHNIQVEKRWTSELSPVRGNVGQLQQVFVNLIVNAFQAMPQGGTLTITTGVRNGNVMVAVRDTGCGIPEQNLARLFDPFFTTKPSGQGTGLGLSVSRGIIEMHQGTIEVESEVGRGSCFTVYLPVASKEETRRDEVSESSGGG